MSTMPGRRVGRYSVAAVVAAPLIVGLLLTSATPATADATLCSGGFSTCTAAGYTDHGYGAHHGTSYWGAFPGHNCTNYVAYVLQTVNHAAPPGYQLGNAADWDDTAQAHHVTVNATPTNGSVAQWNAGPGRPQGHVAYVEVVNPDGSLTISQDSYPAGPFSWQTISPGSSNWPHNFIHFADLHPSSPLPASRHQMTGDVNGDGKADAVVFYPGPGLAGNWYVAPSTGSAFAGASLWIAGTGAGSDRQFLSDVNGDGKSDAVMYWSGTGNYLVALSGGSSFLGGTWWSLGQIGGSTNQLMGDVNGDGRADAVVYSAGNGTWYASLSDGASFTGFGQWATGHGAGSSNQLLADVTGDGRADAVAFFGAPHGWWYVAPSTGSTFGGANPWATGYGSGSSNQILADVTGDGRADALSYFGGTNGWWYVAPSNGSHAFTAAGLYANGYGVNSSHQLAADLTGDGRSDAIVYEGGTLGNWWTAQSNGANAPFNAPTQWAANFGIGS